jgi:Ca2+-binding RTX toxin-like protein
MRRMLTTVAVAAAALLAPAALAQAATISEENGTLVYRGEGSEGISLLVSMNVDWQTQQPQLWLSDSGADRVVVQSGACVLSDFSTRTTICPLNPNKPLRVEGSAGADSMSVFNTDVPDSMPIEFHGGGGDDQLEDAFGGGAGRVLSGGPGNDLIQGHHGNDAIDGGDGNDEVDGGDGDDQVRAGAGHDVLWGDHYYGPGADLLDGGPGTDTTEEWTIPDQLDRQPAVAVTFDGAANDGRPGEGDNVVGIERLDMYVVGNFVGGDGAEQIKLVNPGNSGGSRLIGNGGDDVLVANDYDDVVDGGAGADTVEGGHGNDTVTGGPGADVIYGDATSAHCGWYSCKVPFGNDVIQARDGVADTINCGIGTDRAVVDPIDVVAGCETVESAEGGGEGGGGGGGGGRDAAFAVSGGRSLRALLSRGLTVSADCNTACRIAGALHVDRRTARKLRLRGTKVGSGNGRAARAGTATARLKVTGSAKRRLRRLRKATITVRVTVTPKGGPAIKDSRRLQLKR